MPSQATCRDTDRAAQLAAQHAIIARCEAALWEGGFNAAQLPTYQAAWRDLEALIAAGSEPDRRHAFILVIPVADSPRQLRACLTSLLELCRAFGYGGMSDDHWRKLSVLLADDSADAAVLAQNRALAEEFAEQGLRMHYFGPGEQLRLMDSLGDLDLTPIVGRHDRAHFGHKGQAMMRNIAYLKVAQIQAEEARIMGGPLLIYTLDADQEFKLKLATAAGEIEVAALSFFHQLDALFNRAEVQVLTGKVVGDPPVSPAVMAGNYLDDVIGFLTEMAHTEPARAYPRHIASTRGSGEAAYHDMADLFGFKAEGETYRFRCPYTSHSSGRPKNDLAPSGGGSDAVSEPGAQPTGEPSNAACFADFARRLNSFFHGEHPTRVTYYRHDEADVVSARTVYTGNYLFRPELLDWFIPYAPLRLRMSGPSMGRLLKAELGGGFVSANLPMLHRRTLETTGQSEFRPGVVEADQRVDLSGEFDRQFHGDVMLFAMQRLTVLGYPGTALTEQTVLAALDATRAEMRQRYHDKQQAILARLERLQTLLNDPAHWWNLANEQVDSLAHFHTFIANLRHNFGPESACYTRLDAPGHWPDWRSRQLVAISGLPDHRRHWQQALDRLQAGQ